MWYQHAPVAVLGIVLAVTAAYLGWRTMKRSRGAAANPLDPFLGPIVVVLLVICGVLFALKS